MHSRKKVACAIVGGLAFVAMLVILLIHKISNIWLVIPGAIFLASLVTVNSLKKESDDDEDEQEKKPLPWKEILSCVLVLSLIALAIVLFVKWIWWGALLALLIALLPLWWFFILLGWPLTVIKPLAVIFAILFGVALMNTFGVINVNKMFVKEQIVENQTVENETVENETVENQTVENQTVENETVENQTVENQTVENQSVKNQTVENQTVENQTVKKQQPQTQSQTQTQPQTKPQTQTQNQPQTQQQTQTQPQTQQQPQAQTTPQFTIVSNDGNSAIVKFEQMSYSNITLDDEECGYKEKVSENTLKVVKTWNGTVYFTLTDDVSGVNTVVRI